MLRAAFAVTLAILALAACAQTPKNPDPASGPFRIGTGGSPGVYYVLGQAICKRYRATVDVVESECAAPAGGGSVANLKSLSSREYDLTIAHSDWVQAAGRGTSLFAEPGPMRDLRAVASFYPEPLSILVKRDTGISDLRDLKNARIAWFPKSWAANLFRVVLAAKGWDEEDFTGFVEVKNTRAALDAFCGDRVDVMLTAAGHPSGTVRQATSDCDGTFLQISGEDIAAEIPSYLSLSLAEVPAGMYLGQSEVISTLGSRPLLVTRSDVPDNLVRALAEAVFEDLATFKKLHPAFASLTPDEMMSASIPVPLHPAAKAYYQEKRLLP